MIPISVKASASVTLSCVVDVAKTTRYYLLQASTLAAPAKPSANPPAGGWNDTEPAYVSGSTNTLYFCDCTEFSDGTFAYSMVSVSSAYEAAKLAYNQAQAAAAAAQQAQDDIDHLHIGGRNLIRRTLYPNVQTAATRPGINDCAYTVVSAGTHESAEHGLKVTSVGAVSPYITFGETTVNDASLMGLVPGETYTFSCDARFKMYSGEQTATTYAMMLYMYHNAEEIGTLKVGTVSTGTAYKLADYRQELKGTEMSRRVAWTFTVPEGATKLFFRFKPSNNTARLFAAGDFIELKNLKLEKGCRATDWTPAPEDIDAAITGVLSYADSAVSGVQAQVDGKIDTWFFDEAPTESNAPAKDWNAAQQAAHTDDLYYNTATGYCYRWTGSAWSRIKDSDISSAMSAASAAQDTADHKRRVFTAQPAPPYDPGDLWAGGSSADLKICGTAKAAGQSYAAADWALATASVTEAASAAAAAASAASAAQSAADSASVAAGLAQSAANSKRRVFTVQPTPPYDPGDLWAGGASADLKVCAAGRASGSYNAADWVLASSSLGSLEIGCRNFLLNSDRVSAKTVGSSSTSVYSSNYNLSDYGAALITEGADYTVSFDYEVDTDVTTQGSLYVQLNSSIIASGTHTVPDVIQAPSGRAYSTFKATAAHAGYTGAFYVRIRLNNANGGAAFRVWNLKLEKGNKPTDWTPAPEDLADEVAGVTQRVGTAESEITQLKNQLNLKVSQTTYNTDMSGLTGRMSDAESEIELIPGRITAAVTETVEMIGSRNLIRSTMNPDASSENTRPNLNGVRPMEINTGTAVNIPHGMGIMLTSAVRPILRFGANSNDVPSLYGLVAGEKYTLSFNAVWKVLSGTISDSTNGRMFAGLYVNYTSLSNSTTLAAADQYKVFGTVTPSDRGTMMSGRCEFTFTVPQDATILQLRITCDRTTASFYASGDYIYVSNLKLEKGEDATAWSAAPEDADRVQNSSLQISPDGIEMKSGVIDMEAGSKFRVKSGGKFEVFATDDASYISFGGTEQSPNFSLGSGGTVNAKRGVFDELTVKSSSMMQAMNGSLGDKIMVSDTQPTGHGILWVQPSAVTQVDFILPGSHGEDMSGETPSQELTGFLPQGGQLGGTQCTYGVKLSIGNITGTCRWEYVKVQAQKSSGGSKITIYEKTYASGNQPIIHPYDSFVIDTLNSPSAALTNLTDAASITLTVTIRKSDSTYARFNVNENFILRCTGTGSATAQACNVYFIP